MLPRRAIRHVHPLLTFLLFSCGVSFAISWLPLIRVLFEGQAYEWSFLYFGMEWGGKGWTSGFGLLLVINVLFLLLFGTFYWQKNRKIWAAALLLWVIHIFGNLLYNSLQISLPEGQETEGVPITFLLIPLAMLSLGWVVLGIWKDRSLPAADIPWSVANRKRVYFLLAFLPIQAVLFMTGEQNGTTDAIAVVLSMRQAGLKHAKYH